MIGSKVAHDGAELISTAIGELMEDAAADAVRVSQGDWRVVVIKADRLKAVGSDVSALAEAKAILARRSVAEPEEHDR